MLVNETRVEEWKLLSFFALLSNYDYFSIQKEDDPTFFATGIERSCGWVLKFTRKFATPVYSDGELVSVAALSATEFKCQIGEFTYYIRALHEKSNALPVREKKDWKNILDFADTEYINKEKCQYIKELDLLVLVVDPDLLGELTAVEESQIKRLINIRLHGNGAAMQMCRSVCFKCQIHSANHIIYAGMYDLENSVSVSSVMVYNSRISQSMSDAEDQQYTNLWNFAQQLYHENFL